MKKSAKYWVYSDILEFGTYTQTRSSAYDIQQELIKQGGTDAKIEHDPWEM